MDYIININLLRNPANWLTIGAMLLLVGVAALAIHSRLKLGGSSTVADVTDNAAPPEYAKEA